MWLCNRWATFVHLHLFRTNAATKLHCRMTSLLRLLSYYLSLLLQKTKGIKFSSRSEEIQNVWDVHYLANLSLGEKIYDWLFSMTITFHGCLPFTRLICHACHSIWFFLPALKKIRWLFLGILVEKKILYQRKINFKNIFVYNKNGYQSRHPTCDLWKQLWETASWV